MVFYHKQPYKEFEDASHERARCLHQHKGEGQRTSAASFESSSLRKNPNDSKKASKITEKTVNFIVLDDKPVKPSYLPGHKYISNTALPKLYVTAREHISGRQKDMQSSSFTTHIWSSCHGRHVPHMFADFNCTLGHHQHSILAHQQLKKLRRWRSSGTSPSPLVALFCARTLARTHKISTLYIGQYPKPRYRIPIPIPWLWYRNSLRKCAENNKELNLVRGPVKNNIFF